MILKHLDGNDFSAPHNGVRKNQRAGNELSLAINITTKHMKDVKKLVEKWQNNENRRLATKNKAKSKKKKKKFKIYIEMLIKRNDIINLEPELLKIVL
jgi:hypothetical protein